jgi:hypothetical protein
MQQSVFTPAIVQVELTDTTSESLSVTAAATFCRMHEDRNQSYDACWDFACRRKADYPRDVSDDSTCASASDSESHSTSGGTSDPNETLSIASCAVTTTSAPHSSSIPWKPTLRHKSKDFVALAQSARANDSAIAKASGPKDEPCANNDKWYHKYLKTTVSPAREYSGDLSQTVVSQDSEDHMYYNENQSDSISLVQRTSHEKQPCEFEGESRLQRRLSKQRSSAQTVSTVKAQCRATETIARTDVIQTFLESEVFTSGLQSPKPCEVASSTRSYLEAASTAAGVSMDKAAQPVWRPKVRPASAGFNAAAAAFAEAAVRLEAVATAFAQATAPATPSVRLQ